MDREESSTQELLQMREGKRENDDKYSIKHSCQLHQGIKLDYFCIDSSQQHVFKCMFCVTDEDVKQHSLIPIQQISSANQKTIFANYPLSDRELTKQVKLIVEQPSTGESLKSDIEKYFKDLRANILGKLDQIQTKMVAKAQTISDFSGEITSLYNKMSEKETLKGILIDSEKSFDGKCSELKELSLRVMMKDAENQQTIKNAIEKIRVLQKAIDFDSPNLIKEQILNSINNINMFLIENMADFSEQLKGSKQAHFGGNQIDDIMKLVRNKFNQVTEDQCSKLEEQLNSAKFAFSGLQVPQSGLLYKSIESLTATQTEAISNLIEEIARLNSEIENNEPNEIKEQLKSEELFELVSNQANFCSIEYLEEIKRILDSLGGMFKLFKIRKLNVRTDEQKAFNRIKIPQLNNLAKLAYTINQLTIDNVDNYLESQYPIDNIQFNSAAIRNHINLKEFEIEDMNKLSIDVDQLFVNYPIFELLSTKLNKANKQLPLVFTKTKFLQSQEMILTQVGTKLQITCPANKTASCVSEVLNKESGYSIKLHFNRPYGQTQSNGFFIGLIENSEIDSNHVNKSTGNRGFYSGQNSGGEVMVQGQKLSHQDVRKVNKELEFRFCISKRQLFISDSAYTNINQVKEDYVDPNQTYRFGVEFNNIVESDWMITITDFKEIDPKNVSNFK